MLRPLSLFLGLRYTRAKRRSHFVSFISLTSIIGLALGVLVMIVVLFLPLQRYPPFHIHRKRV